MTVLLSSCHDEQGDQKERGWVRVGVVCPLLG